MIRVIHYTWLLIAFQVFLALGAGTLWAQPSKPVKEMNKEELMAMSYEDLLTLSLEDFDYVANKLRLSTEELMTLYLNKDVRIASKFDEQSFDAPLSTSVISAEDIENSGATSIEELFRLIPGCIVREETNGNFDVHIRGNDNVPPDNLMHFTENTTTLVMIDNRSVYNFMNGGTFWETFPISLDDIERIEVIRGAASALYGPNAVSGVINIITKEPEHSKLAASLNARYGSYNTLITNAAVNKGFGKLKLRLSGNYEYRDRFQENYYNYFHNSYVPADSVRDLFGNIYFKDDEEDYGITAKDNYGANLFAFYDLSDTTSFRLSAGTQHSNIHNVSFENMATPLSVRTSQTYYADIHAQSYGLLANVSYQFGKVFIDKGLVRPVVQYNMNFMSANLEYNFKPTDKLSIRPGINYQRSQYDDSEFVKRFQEKRPNDYINGLMNGSNTLNYYGCALRIDYQPTEHLRFVGALRGDRYDYPNNIYPSWQLAAIYHINNENLIRLVYSRANRGTFFADVYTNFQNPMLAAPDTSMKTALIEYPPGSGNMVEVPYGVVTDQYYQYYIGNKDLDLLTMDTYEFGIRNKIADMIQTDIEIFYNVGENYGALVAPLSPTIVYKDTTYNQLGIPYYHIEAHDSLVYQNLTLRSQQLGVSFSARFFANKHFQASIFGNWQNTLLDQHVDNQRDTVNRIHHWTPNWYGGLTFNYSPRKRLNIYTNFYYMSKQDFSRLQIQQEDYTTSIDDKLIWNVKLSYLFWKQHAISINMRDLLNYNQPEFAFADPIRTRFLISLSLKF